MTEADSIAHLDFTDIACQCTHWECRTGCPRHATVKVSYHALDQCDGTHDTNAELDADGNHTLLLCLHCLHMLELHTEQHLKRLNAYGRPHCQTCCAPAASTRPDILREVVAL